MNAGDATMMVASVIVLNRFLGFMISEFLNVSVWCFHVLDDKGTKKVAVLLYFFKKTLSLQRKSEER